MGYRSQVAIVVGPSLVDKFLAVVASSEKVQNLIKYNERRKDGIHFNFYEEGDVFVILNGVKWYDEFEEVGKIMEFVNDACQSDDAEWIRFVRVGEDFDDIEQLGYYVYDLVYVPIPCINY